MQVLHVFCRGGQAAMVPQGTSPCCLLWSSMCLCGVGLVMPWTSIVGVLKSEFGLLYMMLHAVYPCREGYKTRQISQMQQPDWSCISIVYSVLNQIRGHSLTSSLHHMYLRVMCRIVD